MAILSALLSMLARKVGDLVTAILGWSVTALFGQLPSAKKTALSITLLVSLAWPLLVLGLFFPAVTAWAFAFLPIHKWIGEDAVRILSVVLALLVPVVVGAVTLWVAPPETRRGGKLRTVLTGFPLTLGYCVSCLITVVTVPITKIAAVAKRWSDEHVFVQARKGRYQAALAEIAAAFREADVPATVEPVPAQMALATKVIKWFARGGLDPIVADDPKRLRHDQVEAYLYPADLLLRGKPDVVARVRAKITMSMLEREAYLVSDPPAQKIQDELTRLWDVLARHDGPHAIGDAAHERLREVAHRLNHTNVPFDQWVVLDRSLRRLEQALAGGPGILDEGGAQDAPFTGEGAMNTIDLRGSTAEKPAAEKPATGREDVPLTKLVEEAFDEAKELIRTEVALARDEAKKEIAAAKTAGLLLGSALACAIVAVTMLLVALVLAFGPEPVPALVVGGVLLALAVGLGAAGWKAVPKKPLDRTRERVETDVQQLKERVA